ncbi:MAG: chaperone modulator CbpM [Bacteroidota bacterium]
MKTELLTPISEFCIYHKIDESFIKSLYQNNLIDIITIRDSGFVDTDQLRQLERIVRFYYDLGINLEGIEIISALLQRINSMRNEIIGLNNRILLSDID